MIPRFDDPNLYRDVLDELAKKWSARGRLDRLEIDGLSLGELRMSTRRLGKLLARTVGSGEYRYSPLIAIEARIEGKARILYRPNLLDRVVLMVTARYLTVLAEPHLLPVVHSYRKGKSAWKAIAALGVYLQDHRRQVALRQRGLYVLRRDVQKYGENIDTRPNSELWERIERILWSDPDAKRRSVGKRLIIDAIRQPVLGSDGLSATLSRGVPTGSPVQPPCANLYLASLDDYCSDIAGAFYSRFGDDILFCHPDRAIADEVSRAIDGHIAALGLNWKKEKRLDLDFNGAGRNRGTIGPFRACNRLEYLGASIDFRGNCGMKMQKVRDFERELRQRLRRMASANLDLAPIERTRLLCEAVRTLFNPTYPTALRQAEALRHMVTDRSQLRDLDYRVALIIAELVAGRRGPRAFRIVAYAELRRCGLPSLAAQRDRKPGLKLEAP